jgi:predicted transposase YbfD/YdcC
LHWILDPAFREDECRKRSIAGKRLLAGWDTSYMEKVLFRG